MAEPVLGSYYTFKYIGGRVYDPDQYDGEGMFIGRRGQYNVFAIVLPKLVATQVSQNVVLYYTTLNYHRIHTPRDKVMMTSDTKYMLMNHFHSSFYKDPHDNGRVSPTVTISADILLS